MGFAMSLFNTTEWLVLSLWFVAVIAPIVYAVRTRTSLAMGITVAVLLGAVVQVFWAMLDNWGMVEYWVWSDFVLVPVRSFEPAFLHT
ncbi:MAG: hypothetical protein L7R83_03670, partial [Candidatus Poseidonia sp.]|nr:hypothetical protein [Poseidonia sp.]